MCSGVELPCNLVYFCVVTRGGTDEPLDVSVYGLISQSGGEDKSVPLKNFANCWLSVRKLGLWMPRAETTEAANAKAAASAIRNWPWTLWCRLQSVDASWWGTLQVLLFGCDVFMESFSGSFCSKLVWLLCHSLHCNGWSSLSIVVKRLLCPKALKKPFTVFIHRD